MKFQPLLRSLFNISLFVGLLTACESTQHNTTKLVDWIPQNTPIALQLNNPNEVENALKNNPILKHLPASLPELSKKLVAFDNPAASPKIFSITPYGKNEKALSIVYKAPLDSTYLSYPKEEYSGEAIYLTKENDNTLYTAFIDGFTLHADTKIVLENCIRNYQQKAKGINDISFYDIVKTADDSAPFNIHLKGQQENLIEEVTGRLPLFPKIGQNWASLDINFTTNALEIDGLLKVIDSVGDPVGLLHSSEPKKTLITQAIPVQMTSAFLMTMDNIQLLEDKFKKWVRFLNLATLTTDLNALEGVDELGLIQLKNEIALIFHLRNEATAAATFIPESQEKNYRDIAYYKTSLARELNLVVMSLGEQVNAEWVTKIDDFLFFAESKAGIKTLIAAYKDEKTLEKSLRYQRFAEETLSDKSNLLWIGNGRALKEQFPEKTFWKSMDTNKLSYIAFQGVVENDFMYLHFRLSQNEIENNEASVTNVALISLDHSVQSKPQWLKNHRTKEKDIAVQDEQNTLYLYSNTGTLFWKKQIEGKIIGEIQQVDLYKNGRLQMAFRTTERFYILDRNGKVVPPFNKKIKTNTIAQPLAVFDYDQSRNYRFVLAQDKNVVMLDNKGKRVNGFKFSKSASAISAQPKHIRMGNKDYILIKEESGKVNILSRTGQTRVKIKQDFKGSNQDIYSYLKTFTTTDQQGNLIQIDPKGNVISTDLGLEATHEITATTKSLVTLTNNILTIKGIPVTLPYGRYSAPQIFYLNNIVYVSVTDVEAQKVYLYFSDGKAVSGFPVYGISAIDLNNADKDKALEFVVQGESKDLLIYQIN